MVAVAVCCAVDRDKSDAIASCRGQRPCVVNEVGCDPIAWVIGGTELSAGCETLGWELLEHS